MFLDGRLFLHARRVLKNHRRQPVLAYGFPRASEAQFLAPVLSHLVGQCAELLLVVLHFGTSPSGFRAAFPDLPADVLHADPRWFKLGLLPPPDVYLTSEQFLKGLPGAYSLCSFHGQPAKGISLTPDVYASFDAFLTPGPLFDALLDDFADLYAPQIPHGHHPARLGVGYPKSDILLGGRGFAPSVQASLPRLPPGRPTLLYAPAFNEGASLRESGVEVVETLAREGEWNLVVKLPINCYDPLSDLYSTGGVSWPDAMSRIAVEYGNVFLHEGFQIDPLLDLADVLVTCISSVGWDFLCLGKPVVFLDTPKYWNEILPRKHPRLDTSTWVDSDLHNGGRRFAHVVPRVADLPDAVRAALRAPPMPQAGIEEIRKRILYNPGCATESMAKQIMELLHRATSGTGLKSATPSSGFRYGCRVLGRVLRNCLPGKPPS